MKKRNLVSLFASILLLSGCATIMGEKTQLVPITSSPSEATVVITDEVGTNIFKGTTPTSVTLEKSTGKYWGKKSYTVSISKKGYADQIIPISASPNGWYIAGNIVFGGLIGWFIVDPFNGAMYKLTPEKIMMNLNGDTAKNSWSNDGSLSIVLLQDVPNELRPLMEKIN